MDAFENKSASIWCGMAARHNASFSTDLFAIEAVELEP
jgi:hypothetical protein